MGRAGRSLRPRLLEGVPYAVQPYYGSDCHFRCQPFSGGHSAAEKAIKNIEMLPTHKEPRSNGALSKAEFLEMLIVIRNFASIGKLVNFNAEVV